LSLFRIAESLYERSVAGIIAESDLDRIAEWPLASISVLFAAADQVRRRFHGDSVDPCTLMNVKSGGCSEDCAFCAQSGHNNAEIAEYDLADESLIIERCRDAAARGISFCVVSSGRRVSGEEVAKLAVALEKCRGEKHASLGILSENELMRLRRAGVVCYNHNLETGRNFFSQIVSTHSYDDRVATVLAAKRAGMRVCCGGIFGIGESWTDRKELCLELRRLDVDTVPINFFNPIPGTRVPAPAEGPLEFLKIVAFFRMALPTRTIKVCGGREFHLGALQPLLFFAGANGYVTGGYLTTPGAGFEADEALAGSLGFKKKSLGN
jgi:biotin synthase